MPDIKNFTGPTPPSPMPPRPAAANLVIHTMRDDLRDVPKHPARKSLSNNKTVTKIQSDTKSVDSSAKVLPPKESASRSVVLPYRRRKKSRFIWLILALFLIILLSGAGYAWWWYYGEAMFLSVPSGEIVAAAGEVIPADVYAVVRYRLDSAADRSAILSAWSQSPDSDSSADSLIHGNPHLLLDDPQLTEIYYVFLNENPRPFLVVPQTPGTDQIVRDYQLGTVSSINSWYLIHPVSTTQYQDALAYRTMSSQNNTFFHTNGTDSPVGILLGTGAINQVRSEMVGQNMSSGLLLDVAVTSQFNNNGQMKMSGTANMLGRDNFTGKTIDQTLLPYIPADADFVFLGGSLAEDLIPWNEQAQALDTGMLQLSDVQLLLSQLDQPYAFFIKGIDKAHEYGAVIKLSDTALSQIKTDNGSLTKAVSAIARLVTGKKIISPLDFSTTEYNGQTLQYVNFSAPSNTALDYAIVNNFLLIATSKNAMLALVDAALADETTVPAWSTSQIQPIADGKNSNYLAFGKINGTDIRSIIPGWGADNKSLTINMSLTSCTTTTCVIAGAITPSSNQ
ncbi:MAG: hypothetical protein Q8P73_03855 [bacterium]|nr:hypothetical protein [bacterium]